jgi:hypothetical protein
MSIFSIIIYSSLAVGDEHSARKQIKTEVAYLLEQERFSELERIASKYRKTKSRTASGTWELTFFYYGINDYANTRIKDETFWVSLKAKTQRWIKSYPSSPTPYIAHATVLLRHAWSIRGSGYSNTVSPIQMSLFHDGLEKTLAFLNQHETIASIDPHWHTQTATVLGGLGRHWSELESILDKGIEVEPSYYQLYFSTMYFLLPKWGGSAKELDKFADYAVSKTKDQEGMGLYARIYWSASQYQFEDSLFSATNVSWNKMKQGIFDVVRDYPDSWNTNSFAYFSCLAGDKNTTKSLRDKIGDNVVIKAWRNPDYYKRCKSWAYSS